MKSKVLLIGTIAVLGLSASVLAADVSGKWVAEMQGRQGPTQTTFDFKVEGAKLTGTVTTPRGENPISEGKIEGDNISFVVVISFGGNEMKQLYKGVVSGDEIKFTREFQGGMMGGPGPGGGAPGAGAPGAGAPGGMGGGAGRGGPMEFVAKRVK